MEVAGPLGTLLDLAQRKRASPRGEAGTSGFLCVSDSDRRVPAELGQESQASSRGSRIPPQLEKTHVVPTSWQDEALARDGVSREVPCSALKGETEKQYVKAVYCHPAYLTSMQSTS